MRIIIFNRLQFSGVTGHVCALAETLKQQGMQPFLVLAGYPNTLRKKITPALRGVECYFIQHENEYAKLIASLRPAIIHVHSPADFARTAMLARRYRVRWIATIHPGTRITPEMKPYLAGAAAILYTGPQTASPEVSGLGLTVEYFNEGIDLQHCFPVEKGDRLTITFAGKIGRDTFASYAALCKAVDILDDRKFRVIANKRPSSIDADYRGWVPSAGEILSSSDVVVGSGRFMVEGLAAGNAVLVLGQTYQGLFDPENRNAAELDTSGLSGKAPCYREIFIDLADFYKDRVRLRRIQKQSRLYACENHDLHLIGEKVARLYHRVFTNTNNKPAR